MPTQTFFNLQQEKKDKIIEAAINEFTRHPFKTASIATIVREADIPRGSFYQYFQDKKDIYLYIINLIVEQKKQRFLPIFAKAEEYTFFEMFEAMVDAGIQLAVDNPRYQMIMEHFLKDEDIKNEMMEEGESMAVSIYGAMLQRAIAKGEIREDINIEVVTIMLQTMSVNVADQFFKRRGSKEFIEIKKDIQDMVDIIKKGLSK